MGGVCRAVVQPAGYEVALLRYGIESGPWGGDPEKVLWWQDIVKSMVKGNLLYIASHGP